MKKHFILSIITLVVFFSCQRDSLNTHFDFSGIANFWNVYEKLRNNENPNLEEWSNLFQTPGYEVLTQSEFNQDYFKNYFSLAFMPDKSKELDTELSKTHWKVQYLKHLTKIIDNESLLKEKELSIKKNKEILFEALELTKSFLPHNVNTDQDLPPVSFVFFGNDARGYSKIVIDFLYFIENEETMKYLIAHEAHHYYRNQNIQVKDTFDNIADESVVGVLNQIQAEGIADQIDKKYTFFNDGINYNSKWAIKYRDYLDNSETILFKVDSILLLMSNDKSDREGLAEELQNTVPMSGHPTGYYMTKAIISELGIEEIIKSWTNPFEFIFLYQQAAENANGNYPLFSKKSLTYIKSLQVKYNQ